MAHLVIIEDSKGDITDVHWYCSDSCAKTDEHYFGWNGCIEIHDAPQLCVACGDRLAYYFTHPRTHVTRYVDPTDEDYTTAWRWT